MEKYKEMLEVLDTKIDSLLEDILYNSLYKSSRAEERLTALCLARNFIKEKLGVTNEG